jgi:hypothetical protein
MDRRRIGWLALGACAVAVGCGSDEPPAPVAGPYCGDGTCGPREAAATCPADCGTCQPSRADGGPSAEPLWSKGFGDAADDEVGWSVAVDGAGNVIVTGTFGGTVDFGGGPLVSAGQNDLFVAKLDAAGNHLWSKRFGDADMQMRAKVAVDGSGNVVLAGGFYGTVDFGGGPLVSAGGSDIFVAELDAAGDHLWSQAFGDAADDQAAWTVVADSAGSVVLAGPFAGTVDFGGGPLVSASGGDLFVTKLDASGNHLWSKLLGDAGSTFWHSIGAAADGSDDLVLTGGFTGTVDFGGVPLVSAGGGDIFVAKLDAAGNHLWSERFGDADDQSGAAVAVDGSGNVVLTGYARGTTDFGGAPLTSAGVYDVFVTKLDASGQHLWSQRFGDEHDQWGVGVAIDGAGNVLLTGTARGLVDFGGGALGRRDVSDAFLAKFDPSGSYLWSTRLCGGASSGAQSNGQAVAVDGSNDVLFTGNFKGTVDFGSGPLVSAGGDDVLVGKFGP